MRLFFLFFLLNINSIYAQVFNLNQKQIENHLRDLQLLSNGFDYSFTIKANNLNDSLNQLIHYNSSTLKKKNFIRILPVDFITEYTTNHPYNRNNGIMIPNKGFQSLISLGIKSKLGPLEIIIKPEYLYAENLDYEGFWRGHYPLVISKRQNFWNHIDLPEKFGNTDYKEFSIGQSSINLNLDIITLSLSNENLWWGPSIRNSIMLSNNAKSFPHISIKNNKRLKFILGSLDFQFISGELSNSNFKPSYSEYKYAGHLTFVPKNNDSRFLQAINIHYNPNFIKGLNVGFIRWIQMYMDFQKNNNDYFPVFDNLLRKNDKYGVSSNSKETERDQAAGLYFRWLWEKANAEFYGEFYYNDSKANFRDLLLDSDHARASSIGIQKLFTIDKKNYYKFFWEWTQLEQTSSRLLRNAGSWYTHSRIRQGYTNRGEIIGASIGPGSNSHYFGVTRKFNEFSLGAHVEIIDQDNDFLYYAFENAQDFRRYWKDYNFHINFSYRGNSIWGKLNLMYSRSINYNWALEENFGSGYNYYIPGIDKNNFLIKMSITYFLNL